MSTTGIESWAVDLKDVAAVYPFQGWEVVLTIVGLVAWIGWHIWCFKWENKYHEKMVDTYNKSKK